MAEKTIKTIRPQEGYQMKASSSKADIVIGGAAAGVGKTYILLLEFLRHIQNPLWGGVIFRRTSPQIKSEGGLWDTSVQIYPKVGAVPRESSLEWLFPKGCKMKFSHLEYEKDVLNWQGSQAPFIGFDELTHFTEKMFFYLLSRNRSVCGVKPYVRATCNPDPESWVAKLISWWIDEETGFPIPERDGVVRFFVRDGNEYIWGDTAEEVIEKAWYMLESVVKESGLRPQDFVKSLTFISGSIYQNKELLSKDPSYLANLMSQGEEEKASLLYGNWKVVLNDNDLYDYYRFTDMFENSFKNDQGQKYITADIALKGSNKFIVGAWHGFHLMDGAVVDKSNGKEVIEVIKQLAAKHRVPNSNITYDNDGVGGFVDGFIVNAIPFNNGTPAIGKEQYLNLKTQCYYKSSDRVANSGYTIDETFANRMYDDKMTIRQRFIHERKAIKRDKVDSDGKLRIIPKDKMKVILNGDSPDLMDMFMMREYFELKGSRFGVR